jgi:hypothetical protein
LSHQTTYNEMILPAKHIRVSESLLGLGGLLLHQLSEPMSIEDVWEQVQKATNTRSFPAYHSFDDMILALDFLYLINALEINSKGQVYNAIIGIKS